MGERQPPASQSFRDTSPWEMAPADIKALGPNSELGIAPIVTAAAFKVGARALQEGVGFVNRHRSHGQPPEQSPTHEAPKPKKHRVLKGIGITGLAFLLIAPPAVGVLAGAKSAGRAVAEGSIGFGGKPKVVVGEIEGVKKILFQKKEVTVTGLENNLVIHMLGKDLSADVPFVGKVNFNPSFKTTVTNAKRTTWDYIDVSDIKYKCDYNLPFKRAGGTQEACTVEFDPSNIHTIVEATVDGPGVVDTVSTTGTGGVFDAFSPLLNNEEFRKNLPDALKGKDPATTFRKTLEGTTAVAVNYAAAAACMNAFKANPEAKSLMGDAVKKNVAKIAIQQLSEEHPDEPRPDVDDFSFNTAPSIEADATPTTNDTGEQALRKSLQDLIAQANSAGIADIKLNEGPLPQPACEFTAKEQE